MALQFWELELPKMTVARDGGRNVWLVHTKQLSTFYLINNGNHELHDIVLHAENLFYFDTEFEAHKHACNYYTKHNMMYPYIAEFIQATHRKPMPTITVKMTVNNSGSQVMTF